ncbi:Alpha/Beta hydrolase protein [Aspergillus avenaceus]|uniref:Alpha/Beta hydrolase protein n=1 Tax=Aspergillus avenaceus TaxID=36643 RepID=A0A5N6U6F8_ASPAV|nr:Alpha/Beta hydrolase protein [Aspergillus avenaceus]
MSGYIPLGGQTLVYSTVDGHDVKFDYYIPAGAQGKRPAVIFYHGGGMTAGSRRGVDFPLWLYHYCQEQGYFFIGADYRLCHPSTAFDQIDDARALFQFLTGDGFQHELPASIALDPARIAVAGFSAGAYSARAACVYASPKPAVLLTGYGTGGDWLLDHWVTGRPPTSLATLVDLSAVPSLLADRTVVSDDSPAGGLLSSRFALTVRWELDGTFLDGCVGRPGLGAQLQEVPYAQRGATIPDDLRPAFLQLFVTADHPPSVFVHGTADEVVPAQESVHQCDQLRRLGVRTELLLVLDGPHGLVDFGSGLPLRPSAGSVEAYQKALAFVTEIFQRT